MKSYSWDAFLCASMALYICNLLWGIFVYKAHMLVSNDGSVHGYDCLQKIFVYKSQFQTRNEQIHRECMSWNFSA